MSCESNSCMVIVQGGAALPTAAASAAAHSLPGIRSSSLQQSKDTRNLAVPQKQLAAEQPAYEAMAEDTAHSPAAEQQVAVSFVLPSVLLMHSVCNGLAGPQSWLLASCQSVCRACMILCMYQNTCTHVVCSAQGRCCLCAVVHRHT